MRITFAIASVITAIATSSASAATLALDLDGFTPGQKTLSSAFDLDTNRNQAPGWSRAGYEALVPFGQGFSGDQVTELKGVEKTAARGVRLIGHALVTFTYLGEEANFTNSFAVMAGGRQLFEGNGGSVFGDTAQVRFTEGLIDFSYVTSGGGSIANNGATVGRGSLNIAYSEIFNNGTSIITFFGDDTGDSDNDDLAVRIDVAPIPLPAAAWMLLAGLGGVAALGRRKA